MATAAGRWVARRAESGRPFFCAIVAGDTPADVVLDTLRAAGFLLDMVEAGGLLPQLQRRFHTRTTP